MHAERGKARSRLGCFWSLRVALCEQAEFVDALLAFALFQESKAFVQLGGWSFGVSAETFQEGVVVLDRLGIVSLAIRDFSEVELRGAGKIIHRVVVNDILEFASRDGILCSIEVAQCGLEGVL